MRAKIRVRPVVQLRLVRFGNVSTYQHREKDTLRLANIHTLYLSIIFLNRKRFFFRRYRRVLEIQARYIISFKFNETIIFISN